MSQRCAEFLSPPLTGTDGPGYAVSDPQQCVISPALMLKDQNRLWSTSPPNRALVVTIILAALDHKTLDGAFLKDGDNQRETSASRLELSAAVRALANDDERFDPQFAKDAQKFLTPPIGLRVEVHPASLRSGEAAHERPDVRFVVYLEQNACK